MYVRKICIYVYIYIYMFIYICIYSYIKNFFRVSMLIVVKYHFQLFIT